MIARPHQPTEGSMIDALRSQHARIEAMLFALGRQLALFEAGASPDYELIDGIITLCGDCLDTSHRATEESLVKLLLDRQAVDAEIAETFVSEFDEVVRSARSLAAAVGDVFHDAEMPRATLTRLARAFIALCRRHIESEEQWLLPAAVATFTAQDWQTVSGAIGARTRDGASGAAPGCSAAYDRIIAWEAAARSANA